jgi:DNA-binding NtrC family response regulator
MTEPCRVLVVDDEQDFLEVLTERLQLRGLDAHGAAAGDVALELMAQQPFDVVVLDVGMPGLGGIEVLEHIKRRFPATEVLMLSGHANAELAVRGMSRGAFDYLVKPVEFDELLFRIEDAHRQKLLGGPRS